MASEADTARLLEAWAERLDGVPTVLEIPADRPRPQDTSGARLPLELSAETTKAVLERAADLGVSAPSFLLAAFGLAVGRLTGADKLLVAVPVPGGDVLPVRVDLADDRSVGEFVRGVHASSAWTQDAAGVSLRELEEHLGLEPAGERPVMVQTLFSASGDLDAEPGSAGVARFDLAVRFGQDEPAQTGALEYSAGRWNAEEARSFALSYVATVDQLNEAVGQGDVPLGNVRCISPAGQALLEEVNATNFDFPSTSLDELFRAVVARRPDASAIRDAGASLTYAGLAAAAAEQARRLRAAGVREGDSVLIAVPRSVAEAVAIIGTLWAGAAYVGVDLTQPAAHTARIVSKAEPSAAIVAEADAEAIRAHGVAVVGTWQPDWEIGGDAEPMAPADPDRIAYIAFTSGSTGEPKGVVISHRGVIRTCYDASYLRIGADDRVLRMSPLAFDASTAELFGALLAGAALDVAPPGLLSPAEIGEFIAEREVTWAWLTAGLFRLVQEIAPASFASLRHQIIGGDVAPYEHVARALTDHPGLNFTNFYGPTENTVFTSYFPVLNAAAADGPLPIGKPIPGTRVYVLDRRFRLLGPGSIGELYTGGEGLAVGYIKDKAETDRCFGEFSPDIPERIYKTGDVVRMDHLGRIHFLGRADHQVKIRGYRIELTAISDVLNSYSEVEDAVVIVADGGSAADKRLLAAVRLAAGTEVTPVELKKRLAERLPSFMVPLLWAVVERIPVTAIGKIDRKALTAAAKPANVWGRKKKAE